jgi:DNA (cytosine-5)-methyltransferase 1
MECPWGTHLSQYGKYTDLNSSLGCHREGTEMRDLGLRSLELFSGAGGLALGTHLAGFRHAALVEWDIHACQTLLVNSLSESVTEIADWQVIQEDARKLSFASFGPVDLIAGGPPCQPFSIGGKARRMNDERDMIPQFARAVRELLPAAFIMENVRGLLRPSFATYFSYVLHQLAYPTINRRPDETWLEHLQRLEDIHTSGGGVELRYQVVFRQVNAADYGVPQHRRRIFIVGFRADLGIEWHFPEATHGLDALLNEQWVTGNYWERHRLPQPTERPFNLRLPMHELVPVRPWRTVRDAIADLPEPRGDTDHPDIFNHRLRLRARAYVGHTGSPLDLPAKALKAGDHGVPGGENMIAFPDGIVRYFTAREAARLQTFPDTWRLEGAWTEAMRQMGNAVPVDLARVIATSVAQALEERQGAWIRTPTGSTTLSTTAT